MSVRKKIRLGDLLVEQKLISQGQLDEALSDQKKSGRKLGRILIENGYSLGSALFSLFKQKRNILVGCKIADFECFVVSCYNIQSIGSDRTCGAKD